MDTQGYSLANFLDPADFWVFAEISQQVLRAKILVVTLHGQLQLKCWVFAQNKVTACSWFAFITERNFFRTTYFFSITGCSN